MDTPNHAEAAGRLREALAAKADDCRARGEDHLAVGKANAKRFRKSNRKRKLGSHRHHVEVEAGDVLAVAEAIAGEHTPALRERSDTRDVADPGHPNHLPFHPSLDQTLQILHFGCTDLDSAAEVTLQTTCLHKLLSLYDKTHTGQLVPVG